MSKAYLVTEHEALENAVGPVSRETFLDLKAYSSHFFHWNRSINLASTRSFDDFWHRHIIDSAQLAKFSESAIEWVDIGSGGGLPGLVIALMRRDIHVHLVESSRKKAAFLQNSIGRFGLKCTVHACRVEDCHIDVQVDVVSARALAKVDVLLGYAHPWLSLGARALFLKGKEYAREVEESADDWCFDLIEHPSLTESQSAVLEFRNVRRRRP